ncbi:MAG: hypothetical protein LBB76_11265 [Azoarcus sp.]|jgi:hypothetical protein|nr:hypothetical protein [Azoarcus sp.]
MFFSRFMPRRASIKRLILFMGAVVLPYRLSFAILRWRAARGVDDPAANKAFAMACAHGQASDRAAFCRRFVLYRLVDELDQALISFRGWGWHRRWVRTQGPQPPTHGPLLAITFHYGAGMHAVRALGCHEQGISIIHAPPEAAVTLGDTVGLWLARLRRVALRRLSGAEGIVIGHAATQSLARLAAGGAILALADVPHFGQQRTVSVPFCGDRVGLTTGLARLAIRAQAPVYVFSCALADDSPHRLLRIHGPLPITDPVALTQEIGHLFEATVQADPAAWHYWNIMSEAFPPPCSSLQAA